MQKSKIAVKKDTNFRRSKEECVQWENERHKRQTLKINEITKPRRKFVGCKENSRKKNIKKVFFQKQGGMHFRREFGECKKVLLKNICRERVRK